MNREHLIMALIILGTLAPLIALSLRLFGWLRRDPDDPQEYV